MYQYFLSQSCIYCTGQKGIRLREMRKMWESMSAAPADQKPAGGFGERVWSGACL